MNVFEQIGNSSATGGGNYLRMGRYRLRLSQAQAKKGFKGESIITEWRVLTAEKTSPGDEPNAPGATVSVVFNFQNSMAAGNAKAMLLGLLGFDESAVKPGDIAKLAQELVSPNQPLRGMDVDVETYQKTASKSGKLLTLPNWKHVTQTKEDITKQRAELDKGEATPSAPLLASLKK